jgi:hypothetical protein
MIPLSTPLFSHWSIPLSKDWPNFKRIFYGPYFTKKSYNKRKNKENFRAGNLEKLKSDKIKAENVAL